MELNEKIMMDEQKYLLLDWGDTLMKVYPESKGPMKNWRHLEVFPHAIRWLGELKKQGWQVILVTNAKDSDEEDIWSALHRVGLGWVIDRIFCFKNLGLRKPDPAFYQRVLEELGAQAQQVTMLGDDFAADVQGANRVGIPAIWFNPGSSEQQSGEQCCTIHHYRDLSNALQTLGRL